MLVFRLKEKRVMDTVYGLKVVNKFFVPLKNCYYTTLPYILSKVSKELNINYENSRVKVISLLNEYYELGLKDTIMNVKLVSEMGRESSCDDYFTLLALGFTPEEAGKILNISDYEHLHNVMVEQLANIILESFEYPEKKEGRQLRTKLKEEPLSFTVPELIKLAHVMLLPKVKRELYGIYRLKSKIDFLAGVTYWMFGGGFLKGVKHLWAINPYSKKYKVYAIGDFSIIKREEEYSEVMVDATGEIRDATVEDAEELLYCLPKLEEDGEIVLIVNLKENVISKEYVRIVIKNGHFKPITKCRVYFDYSSDALFAVFKKHDRVWLTKFRFKKGSYFNNFVRLPGFGDIRIIRRML